MQPLQGKRFIKKASKQDLYSLTDILRWPKMDLTNVRSMELFRKLGLADELRKQGSYDDANVSQTSRC